MSIIRDSKSIELPSGTRQRWKAFLAPRSPQAILDTCATMDEAGVEVIQMLDNCIGDDGETIGVLVIGRERLIQGVH